MDDVHLNRSISRFWEKYIEKSKRYNIPDHLIKWYVRHAELYIKDHSLRLNEHVADTAVEYCQAKGRNIHFKDQ
ncbi:hypothetical protein MNBD_GAMMA09-1423 [hydrothermal vent metagenome]|uniref:Uncharacterized protein n=1 Tax=hydrothermal vent metagenome TaxID=652676 RepID=A0A3B0XYK1_9ZZZZ